MRGTPLSFVFGFLQAAHRAAAAESCASGSQGVAAPPLVDPNLRWGDSLGLLTMLMTFSPLSGDVMVRVADDFKDLAKVTVVRLHEISTESDMSKA